MNTRTTGEKENEMNSKSQETMTKYATAFLELDNERVSPDEGITSGELSVTRERLHHFNLVDNGPYQVECSEVG